MALKMDLDVGPTAIGLDLVFALVRKFQKISKKYCEKKSFKNFFTSNGFVDGFDKSR